MNDQKSSPELVPQGVDFKDTLNLPRTDFPLRADAKINDPLMLARWDRDQLYAQAWSCHEGKKKFVLHDGPPYANGHIHLGHAYNKILKDIITKARRMMGYHVPVTPGWDCHGLPIEHKVSQENPGVTGAELKQACRAYATRWVETQRDEFKQLGVVMDWERPYITMNPRYEAATIRVFADLVEKGFIERKNKTIPWCFNCKTALASAEIEYQDRKDPSLFVLFELDRETVKRRFAFAGDEPVYFVIWTTTPWTIPLNRAVLLKDGATYQVVQAQGKYLIIGTPLVAGVMRALECSDSLEMATFVAESLAGAKARHPLIENLWVPVIFDGSVGLDEGTAAVHCAPGCGPSDYEVGVKHGLEIYSPLTADGHYTADIVPHELIGMSIADAQIWVIKALSERGNLLFKTSIRHSYPHCWRCHNGLMFRATPQWFCNLQHQQLQKKAVAAINEIVFNPEQGKNFLRATVENRWEWCLSRQRSWGTPIPALLGADGSTFVSAPFIRAIADRVEKEGIEYWDRVTMEDLRREGLLPDSVDVGHFKKETDILDVWFDAGVSHVAVLEDRKELGVPADLYCEGIDQHRGWFQSSLLTSMMVRGVPPMKAIMTHGFTVDEQGRKMSKSVGNVVAPNELIDQIGTDGLRLWVSSIGNDGDAVVSQRLIDHVSQVYRKIRNTCRFLLQNLYDYNHERDTISIHEMAPMDQYALYELLSLQERVLKAYEKGDVTAIFHQLNDYCTVHVSAFYGDVAKDILYCDGVGSLRRRSVQTAFWHMLDGVTRLMAPVLSFAAEQIADHYQPAGHPSIHLQEFADLGFVKAFFADRDRADYESEWRLMRDMRSAVLKLIEEQRAQGLVKHSLEASVTMFCDGLDNLTIVQDWPEFFKNLFIVSDVMIVQSCDGLIATNVDGFCARVTRMAGTKCPRCWQWGAFETHPHGLCARCTGVVGERK